MSHIRPFAAGKRRRVNIALLVPCFLFALFLGGVDARAEGIQDFWSRFKAVVNEGSAEGFVRLCRIPLEVRGESDADEVKHFDASSVSRHFRSWLQQDSGLYSRETSMQKVIVETDVSAIKLYKAQNREQFRVGSFVFEAAGGGPWKLTRVYVAE